MMRKSVPILKIMLAAVVLIIASSVTVYFCTDDLVMWNVEKYLNCKMMYAGSRIDLSPGIVFYDMTAKDEKRGFIVTSDIAGISVVPDLSVGLKVVAADLSFENITISSDKEFGSFPSNLLESDLSFNLMKFRIIAEKEKISVSNLIALSDDIRVTGGFSVERSGSAFDIDLELEFSGDFSKKILGDGRGMVLTPRADGWYGMNFSLKGDPSASAFDLKTDLIEIRISEE